MAINSDEWEHVKRTIEENLPLNISFCCHKKCYPKPCPHKDGFSCIIMAFKERKQEDGKPPFCYRNPHVTPNRHPHSMCIPCVWRQKCVTRDEDEEFSENQKRLIKDLEMLEKMTVGCYHGTNCFLHISRIADLARGGFYHIKEKQ